MTIKTQFVTFSNWRYVTFKKQILDSFSSRILTSIFFSWFLQNFSKLRFVTKYHDSRKNVTFFCHDSWYLVVREERPYVVSSIAYRARCDPPAGAGSREGEPLALHLHGGLGGGVPAEAGRSFPRPRPLRKDIFQPSQHVRGRYWPVMATNKNNQRWCW